MTLIGLQTFIEQHASQLKNRRVGLISHAAAVAPNYTHTLDILLQHNLNVTTLFGPEHGFDGAGADATAIDDARDPRTGLPVYSLYGASKAPSPMILQDEDILVFDRQDVGVRFYTFISTLAYVMRAAARAGKEIMVLDRPNPLNGTRLEGPLVDAGLESFISHLPVPIRHGFTTGELARFIARTQKMDLALTVVPMQGWTRAMYFDETSLRGFPSHLACPALPPRSHIQAHVSSKAPISPKDAARRSL